MMRVHAVGQRRHRRGGRARVHVVGQVGRQAQRQRQRAARGLHVAFDGLEIEPRLARRGAGLEHVGDGGEADPPPLFGRGEVGLRLLQRGALRLEQRAVRQVLEVGDLDLEHHVLDRGVVGEARGHQPLPRAADPAGPPAEIEQQVVERHARREHRLLDRRPALARRRLEPRRADVAVDRGKPRPALGAVDRRRRLGVGPGQPGRRVVAEPEVRRSRRG